jgi:hypothetical protein
MNQVHSKSLFTEEQRQSILYGPFFNGLDAPLKPLLQVKIEQSWAREQARRQAAASGTQG